jgi:hypothetical protein
MRQTIIFLDPQDRWPFRLGMTIGVENGGREMRVVQVRTTSVVIQPASYRWKHGKVQRRHQETARRRWIARACMELLERGSR